MLLLISLAHHVVAINAITRALADPDPAVRLTALEGTLIAAENRSRAFAATAPAASGDRT